MTVNRTTDTYEPRFKNIIDNAPNTTQPFIMYT